MIKAQDKIANVEKLKHFNFYSKYTNSYRKYYVININIILQQNYSRLHYICAEMFIFILLQLTKFSS